MKIRPLYDRIVVKRIEQQEQMHGGLYIPDTAKEKPQEGEVVAVGKGKRLEDGKVIPLGRRRWRPYPLRQVLRQRYQAGRRRAFDHA